MQFGLKKKLDYSDYAAIPDDGKRYEVLDGRPRLMPSTDPFHQRVSRRLQRQLEDYFEARSLGEVFNAPIDVILSNHDILQPDLVVVARPEQVSNRGIEGAPLLVVEILSPSSFGTDKGIKAARYTALGVLHYWIVDPDAQRIECFRSRGGEYERVCQREGTDSLVHPDGSDLVLDLAALWH